MKATKILKIAIAILLLGNALINLFFYIYGYIKYTGLDSAILNITWMSFIFDILLPIALGLSIFFVKKSDLRKNIFPSIAVYYLLLLIFWGWSSSILSATIAIIGIAGSIIIVIKEKNEKH